MWTGRPVHNPNALLPQPSWLYRQLSRFALSAFYPLPNLVLTVLNRTIDKLGWGDSLLIELELVS